MVDLKEIVEGVVEGNASRVEELTHRAIDEGKDLEKIIYEGLVRGMDIVGEKWRKKEFYVPEVLIASRAMKAGMNIVTPLLKREMKKIRSTIRVIVIIITLISPFYLNLNKYFQNFYG